MDVKLEIEAGEIKSQKLERDFYSDLDETKKKNCCSLPAIIIILLLVFVALVASAIYLKKSTNVGIGSVADRYNQDYSKITDNLLDRASTMQPGQTAVLEFNEAEVSSYLGTSDSDFPLRNTRLSIDETGIHLSGRAGESIFSLPISAVIKPRIEQNKLLLSIDNVSTGSIALPQSIRNKINSYLDLIVRSRPIYDDRLELTSVTLQPQVVQINIHKK